MNEKNFEHNVNEIVDIVWNNIEGICEGCVDNVDFDMPKIKEILREHFESELGISISD